MKELINVDELSKEINESYNKLAGDFLELSEGYFKIENGVNNKRWKGFRKLVLDMINIHKRYILSKLEGKNYYHFFIKKEGETHE